MKASSNSEERFLYFLMKLKICLHFSPRALTVRAWGLEIRIIFVIRIQNMHKLFIESFITTGAEKFRKQNLSQTKQQSKENYVNPCILSSHSYSEIFSI